MHQMPIHRVKQTKTNHEAKKQKTEMTREEKLTANHNKNEHVQCFTTKCRQKKKKQLYLRCFGVSRMGCPLLLVVL